MYTYPQAYTHTHTYIHRLHTPTHILACRSVVVCASVFRSHMPWRNGVDVSSLAPSIKHQTLSTFSSYGRRFFIVGDLEANKPSIPRSDMGVTGPLPRLPRATKLVGGSL